jgi:hypothetical protein
MGGQLRQGLRWYSHCHGYRHAQLSSISFHLFNIECNRKTRENELEIEVIGAADGWQFKVVTVMSYRGDPNAWSQGPKHLVVGTKTICGGDPCTLWM